MCSIDRKEHSELKQHENPLCVKTNPWLYTQHSRILTHHFDEKSRYCRLHDSESLVEDLLLHDCAA